jgi:hypothetical protein
LQETIKNTIKEKWYQMNVFSRPFELGYKDNERSDRVVLSRIYFIFFNTILGELFVHNLLTKGYDWVGSNFYNLPSSAQIFYRRFILHHNYPSIQLNLDTIVENMNFTEKNRSDLIECIETNSLEPLKKNGLIVSYERKEGLQGLKYLITLPQKSKLTSDGMEGSE